MELKFGIKTCIKVGAFMALESMIIVKLLKENVKQQLVLNKAKKEIETLNTAIDLYEIANDTLSKELEEYEKNQEA